jgi:hypothetical protein
MRKASTLVGLMFVALAGSARAQEPAPATPPPAAPAPVAPPVVVVVPAPPPPVVEVASAKAAAPWPPPYSERRIEVGLSFLPMAKGRFTTPIGVAASDVTADMAFAYGAGLMASYRVLAGLSVGVAPQIVWNVKYKVYPVQATPAATATEYDLMARVAYTQPLFENTAVYGEVLPGFSKISQPGIDAASGLVLAVGAGFLMDMGPRAFANLGGGYQFGFQKIKAPTGSLDNDTRYVRVVLGGGVRF